MTIWQENILHFRRVILNYMAAIERYIMEQRLYGDISDTDYKARIDHCTEQIQKHKRDIEYQKECQSRDYIRKHSNIDPYKLLMEG